MYYARKVVPGLSFAALLGSCSVETGQPAGDGYAFEGMRSDLACKSPEYESVGSAQEPLTALAAVCIIACNAAAIGGCKFLSSQCKEGSYAHVGRVQIPCWLVNW